MANKNLPSHKTNKNQSIIKRKTDTTPNKQEIINYLNRIINIQKRLAEPNFNLTTFLQAVLSQAQSLTKATGAVIELIEDDKTSFKTGYGSLKKHVGTSYDMNESISALSINTHQIIRCDDTEKDIRINKKIARSIQAKSLITAPLFHEGKTVGALTMSSKNTKHFNDIGIQTLSIMSGLIGAGISNQTYYDQAKNLIKEKTHATEELKKIEKKLKHTTHHDYLTSLPNRNLFNDQLKIALAKAKRKKQLIALLYLNIDHFKNINNKMGQAIGDKLLYAFAMRLKQCVRASDIVARMNGDEFTLLIDDIKELQDVIVIVDKVFQSVRKPFNINSKILNITTSMGIALSNNPEITPEEFIKQADQALYISKNSGRNNFYIYNNELTHEMI